MFDMDKVRLDRYLSAAYSTSDFDEDMRGDPAIVVAELATEEERVQILARLALLNGGRTEGIFLADALDIMYDGDAMISKVEKFYEEWQAAHPGGEWTPAYAMTVYVLSMLDRPIDPTSVDAFLARRFVEIGPDEEEPAPERTVNFYAAGMLPNGFEVATCSICCALIGDDDEHANREQHARSMHSLGATR